MNRPKDVALRGSMTRRAAVDWMREGFTVLLVTHDVPEAVRLADRVITLEDGRIGGVERVALARPRPPAHPVMATIERRLLDRLLQTTSLPPVHRQEDENNVLETEEETCPRLDAS